MGNALQHYGLHFRKTAELFPGRVQSLLPVSGTALAIADGEGRNSVWLAEQGLEVVSIDFSPTAQAKARSLARERGVSVAFELADAHTWRYPDSTFDVVCEIFAQFSTPREREQKWGGMRKALRPGGLLIIFGYTPKQLLYGTGGPKQREHLYTRVMLESAFSGFSQMAFTEEEREIHEGTSHGGMSAVIGLTCRKP